MGKTLRLPNCDEQALLDQVQVRLVERAELERFNQLLDEHHYLGGLKAVGQRLHYVATDAQGQWLALLVTAVMTPLEHDSCPVFILPLSAHASGASLEQKAHERFSLRVRLATSRLLRTRVPPPSTRRPREEGHEWCDVRPGRSAGDCVPDA